MAESGRGEIETRLGRCVQPHVEDWRAVTEPTYRDEIDAGLGDGWVGGGASHDTEPILQRCP